MFEEACFFTNTSSTGVYGISAYPVLCVQTHTHAHTHICMDNKDMLLIRIKLNENLLNSSLFCLCCCRKALCCMQVSFHTDSVPAVDIWK